MTYQELGKACADCTIAIANNDFTGMSEARAGVIRGSIARIGKQFVLGEEACFSWRSCCICGAPAGLRHVVGYLE